MAKCEKREIVQPTPPVEYVLTLTEDEAMAVYTALGHFGGEPDPTASVYESLGEIRIKARKTFTVAVDALTDYPVVVRR
jgi:hypothetical protein